jgi:hypothetical protein
MLIQKLARSCSLQILSRTETCGRPFNRYALNIFFNIFPIYFNYVLAPLIGWRPEQLSKCAIWRHKRKAIRPRPISHLSTSNLVDGPLLGCDVTCVSPTSSSPYGVTTQKNITDILTAVRTSNLTQHWWQKLNSALEQYTVELCIKHKMADINYSNTHVSLNNTTSPY